MQIMRDNLEAAPAANVAQAADELLVVAGELHAVLKQLLGVATDKLQAMRSADTSALYQCAAQEGRLLHAMFEREKQRNAVIARLAQELHWETEGPPRMSEVAARLPAPYGPRLQATTEGLRETTTALREKNKLAARVARNLHKHIRAVLDEVASANQEALGYGPSGKHEQVNTKSWVDAVG